MLPWQRLLRALVSLGTQWRTHVWRATTAPRLAMDPAFVMSLVSGSRLVTTRIAKVGVWEGKEKIYGGGKCVCETPLSVRLSNAWIYIYIGVCISVFVCVGLFSGECVCSQNVMFDAHTWKLIFLLSYYHHVTSYKEVSCKHIIMSKTCINLASVEWSCFLSRSSLIVNVGTGSKFEIHYSFAIQSNANMFW